MTEESIQEAIIECTRFLARAREYNKSSKSLPSKERAAMRRSSLDASKALSKMRNS